MEYKTILVIDDHALFRSGIVALLSTAFRDVPVLDSGSLDEALTAFGCAPAVILLDIQLSGVSGLEGMDLIRRRWPAARIVVVSAHDLPVTVDAALSRGAVAFLSKSLFDNYGCIILLSNNPPIAMSIMASEVSILASESRTRRR